MSSDDEGSTQPVQVLICPKYCEFGPCFDKCKPWLIKNAPDLYPELVNQPAGEEGKEEGKAEPAKQPKKKKQPTQEVPKVTIKVESRNKKKSTTTVVGMDKFGIKLNDASKMFAKKFSCGCAVVKHNTGDEIVIQGDYTAELREMLVDKWQISSDAIEVEEKKEKKKAAPQI